MWNKFQMERVGGRTFASKSIYQSSMNALTIAEEAQPSISNRMQNWYFEVLDTWSIRAQCITSEGVVYNEVLRRDMRTQMGCARHLAVVKAARIYILLPNELSAFYESSYWKSDEGVLR